MTPDQFREALNEFDLTQRSAADFFGVDERNARRWASGEHPVPFSVRMVFALMRRFNLTAADVDQILDTET